MKKIVIIYMDNQYVLTVDLATDYFEYALDLRDRINRGLDIVKFLSESSINNSINPHDGFFRIESGKTYFYEYAFDIWECANDYKTYEDHTDEMLSTMPYVEIDGVKYY